ncbi:MAG: type II toxin-antitoxin system VapC family toxin [Acidobacteria bacterium]|nr:type II toxin-antitoxin system VapC family toxin [Acidobacteriota bacterium]MBV9068296.1 type II toxin-antitoxin system VapC family toxin [Acidobacteriota bacterium]MBV9184477.1 type II toxin-antitoxin system VapC family toxin [Acidobacteriota bacterium]
MTLLLDTHAWIWWVDQDRRLGAAAIAALDRLPPDQRPFLSDISLWEVATLVELGRLELDVPLGEWLAAAAHPRSVRILPISPAIAADIAALPETFHRDPADRVIVSTCRVMDLALLTRDTRIIRSRLVKRWKP